MRNALDRNCWWCIVGEVNAAATDQGMLPRLSVKDDIMASLRPSASLEELIGRRSPLSSRGTMRCHRNATFRLS